VRPELPPGAKDSVNKGKPALRNAFRGNRSHQPAFRRGLHGGAHWRGCATV